MIFILIGRAARAYVKAWICCPACTFIMHVLIGFTIFFVAAVIWDYNMSQPAGQIEAKKLKNEGWCATDTMARRIEHWRAKDSNYIVTRRDVRTTIRDCREMYESQAQRAAQDFDFNVGK